MTFDDLPLKDRLLHVPEHIRINDVPKNAVHFGRVFPRRRKLSVDQIREIRESGESYVALAKRMGVSDDTIRQVVEGESYQDVY